MSSCCALLPTGGTTRCRQGVSFVLQNFQIPSLLHPLRTCLRNVRALRIRALRCAGARRKNAGATKRGCVVCGDGASFRCSCLRQGRGAFRHAGEKDRPSCSAGRATAERRERKTQRLVRSGRLPYADALNENGRGYCYPLPRYSGSDPMRTKSASN